MVITILLRPPNLHIAFGGKASDTADGDPTGESDSWSLVTLLKPLFILVAEVVETLGNLYSRISPRGATLRKDYPLINNNGKCIPSALHAFSHSVLSRALWGITPILLRSKCNSAE